MSPQTQKIFIDFKKGGRLRREAIRALRTHAELRNQVEALSVFAAANLDLDDVATGTLKARGWNDLIRFHQAPGITNVTKAIQWCLAIFEHQHASLRDHVQFRSQIHGLSLNGKWEETKRLLDLHKERFGPTHWALGWDFVVADEREGALARLEIVEKLSKCGCTDLTVALASLYSLTADKNIQEDKLRELVVERIPALTTPFGRLLELQYLQDASNECELVDVLEYLEYFPVIDRYELFLRIATVSIAGRDQDAVRLGRALSRLGKIVPDIHLAYMVEILEVDQPVNFTLVSGQVLEAWDAYIIGDYSAALTVSDSLRKANPEFLAAHEIYARATLYLGKSDPPNATVPILSLAYHLGNILRRSEQGEESLNHLRRFASRFRILSITFPVRAFHAQQSSAISDSQVNRRAALNQGVHGPRNLENSGTVGENAYYLERCGTSYPSSAAIQFFAALVNTDTDAPILKKVPKVRNRFFSGLLAFRSGDYSTALADLESFLSLQEIEQNNPLSPFAIEEARRVLVSIYCQQNDLHAMQQQIVCAYRERTHCIRRFPVGRVFDACKEDVANASVIPEFPIIAYLACDEPHDVSLALKRFLSHCSVDRPSALIGSKFAHETMSLLFLRACTPEVLDSLKALDSVVKVEIERQTLLEWTLKNSTTFSRIAETEVLRLMQQAELRAAIKKLDGARVILNFAALREAEQGRFSDAFLRYSAQRELVAQLKSERGGTLRFVRVGDKVAFLSEADSNRVFEGKQTEAIAFIAACREVRDAFVSSPHFGIEACLSGRVRHGFLVEHLRRPFVERKLAIRANTPELLGQKEYWSKRLSVTAESESIEKTISILEMLMSEIDSVAEEVRTVWIQSRTEGRNPKGMFDYAFTDEQLINLANRLGDAPSVESFLDAVFDTLLNRTRVSLGNLQTRIRTELLGKMCRPIDNALALLSEHSALLVLRNDLVACRTEIERACQQMVRWFDTNDATLMGDVAFDLVARTAIGMIERLNPAFRGKIVAEIDAVFRVRGRFFTSLVHMAFFLLDNAIRHSGVSTAQFKASVRIEAVANSIVLKVSNEMQSSELAAASASKIMGSVGALKGALEPEKVIREGGSGFAKIIAAIRFEFKQKDPLIVSSSDGTELSVSVRFEAAGLVIL